MSVELKPSVTLYLSIADINQPIFQLVIPNQVFLQKNTRRINRLMNQTIAMYPDSVIDCTTIHHNGEITVVRIKK